MRSWLLATVLGAASCRIDFDPRSLPDAPAPPTPPSLVQTARILTTSVQTGTLAIMPTQPGTVIAVVTVNINRNSAPLTSISDDAGDTWQDAGARYSCPGWVGEIWYVENGIGGAQTITTQQTTADKREIWAVEIGGVLTSGALDGTAVQPATAQTTSVTTPALTPPALPAFVITVASVSGGVRVFMSAPTFTTLGNLNGDEAAYAIATAPGAYDATWTVSQTGTWCGATVAFAAGP